MNARFEPSGPLRGRRRPPADKSISHRAALIGAMAVRAGADPQLPRRRRHQLDAARPSRRSGAIVERRADELLVRGCGLRNAQPPTATIDVGQRRHADAAAARAGSRSRPGMSFTLDGDESIRRRPVDRIAEPLRAMGAADRGARRPLSAVHRARRARCAGSSTSCRWPARRSSRACCSRALTTDATTVIEPSPTRDHTERMLLRAGAPIERDARPNGGCAPRSATPTSSSSTQIEVPGDLSSAAFLIAAGVLVTGSRLLIEASGVNWTRAGLHADPRAHGGDRARRRSSRPGRSTPRSRSPTSTSRHGAARGNDGRAARGPAGDRRAAAGRAARLLRRGRDGGRAARRSCASRSPTGSRPWSRACAAWAPRSRLPTTGSR